MPISRLELTENHFKHTHDLALDNNGNLTFSLRHEATDFANQDQACVYMWLTPQPDTDDFIVNYVGKAGFGVHRRMNQHLGGFTHSATGRENRRVIVERLNAGQLVQVYGRASETLEMFGQTVSMYSTEEAALAERYRPLWNRARFAGVAGVGVPAIEVEVPAVQVDVVDFVHGDDLAQFVDTLTPGQGAVFNSINLFAQDRFPNWQQKIARGHSEQPLGYDGVPTLMYAVLGPTGRALAHQWIRIPLKLGNDGNLNIVFPEPAQAPGINPDLIRVGTCGNWCATNVNDLLQNPNIYLQPNFTGLLAE
jgi:hypothetical protein